MYKFDVAFSFHSADEALAIQLNDKLQDHHSTFLYLNRQEALAGTDGEETFARTFAEDARIVAILYRPEWGQTPFTRIEETAIRKRAYDQGYGFTLFVQTVPGASMPRWLPPTQIYSSLDRFGIAGVLGVIEQRIIEAGGTPVIEDAMARAARFARESKLKQAKIDFMRSELGVQKATNAFAAVVARIVELLPDYAKVAGLNLEFEEVPGWRRILVLGPKYHLIAEWRPEASNVIGPKGKLETQVTIGLPQGASLKFHSFDGGRKVSGKDFRFELVTEDRSAYVDKGGRLFAPDEMAEHLLGLYLDTVQEGEANRTY